MSAHWPSTIPNVQFTVHNFTSNSSITPSPELLNIANNLVSSAATSSLTQWLTPTVPFNQRVSTVSSTYAFSKLPPILPATKGKDTDKWAFNLKEWGAPIEDEEIFHLQGLEEFINSDFSILFVEKLQPSPRSLVRSREPSIRPQDVPPSKKRKLNTQSLHTAIPQPHMLPSSYGSSSRSKKAQPYRKVRPIPIPPHSLPLPPPSPCARNGWIIPIRGILPWDHCTPAIVVEGDLPEPVSEEITWTHKALQSFWSFLQRLQKRGSLGNLGLSYHVAKSSTTTTSIGTTFSSNMLSAPNVSSSIHTHTPEEISVTTTHVRLLPLSSVDYIKVYQDAPNAMFVRNALDAWSYVEESLSPETITKIRVLKGARLVLVDERSKGILVS